MSDNPNTSATQPAEEKTPAEKSPLTEEPPKEANPGEEKRSEAGGEPGEGRTGTKLGSTDS